MAPQLAPPTLLYYQVAAMRRTYEQKMEYVGTNLSASVCRQGHRGIRCQVLTLLRAFPGPFALTSASGNWMRGRMVFVVNHQRYCNRRRW